MLACDAMNGPQRYVDWINAHIGFNPRSAANSNALSQFIIDDLKSSSQLASSLLESHKLVTRKNASVATKVAIRNIDLVFAEESALPKMDVHIAVEHKTVMTAHGKARLNRYGDIVAYCNHMHNHRRDCVVGATVVVNASQAYENPDAFARGLVRPNFKMDKVVADTLRIFENIPLREVLDDPNDSPEALALIVLEYDGRSPAALVIGEGSPSVDSSAHYDNFILRLARLFEDRFGARFQGELHL